MQQIARSVRFPILAGKKDEFTKLFNAEVLPLLKKQDGFKNEIVMVNNDHVVGVSVWSGLDKMKAYESSTYPTVVEKLRSLINGKAEVETFELTTINPLPA